MSKTGSGTTFHIGKVDTINVDRQGRVDMVRLNVAGRRISRDMQKRFLPQQDLEVCVAVTRSIDRGHSTLESILDDAAAHGTQMKHDNPRGQLGRVLSSAEAFGLVHIERTKRIDTFVYSITPLGVRCIRTDLTPERTLEARRDAFLSVRPYATISLRFEGDVLKDDAGLHDAFANVGLRGSLDKSSKARGKIRRSARYADMLDADNRFKRDDAIAHAEPAPPRADASGGSDLPPPVPPAPAAAAVPPAPPAPPPQQAPVVPAAPADPVADLAAAVAQKRYDRYAEIVKDMIPVDITLLTDAVLDEIRQVAQILRKLPREP